MIENDIDLLIESRFSKNDINSLCLKFKNIVMEQNVEYLDYVKNEEDFIIEKTLYKKFKLCFAAMFENIIHKRFF